MKKCICSICIMICCFIILFANKVDVFYGAGASLSGPDSARAGETFTVYLNISDAGKFGIEGTMGYDSSQVTLQSVSSNISGWNYENSGGSFVLYDDQLTNPLGSSATVLVMTFRINDGVTAGTVINVSVSNIITTDGSSESNLGTASCSFTVAAPLSENNNLSSLSVDEGTLSPSFSAGTTSYSIGEVDYSVSKLNVTAVAADSKSTISVSGTSLSVGSNTITITVTAENGATKNYKVTVVRKQDPNYVYSSDASLKTLEVSKGTISPGFSKDIFSYIVYLPYESIGTDFTVSGSAADSKAKGVSGETIEALVEGVNTATVTCTAEDGTTKQTYMVSVVVMPVYVGAIPLIEGVEVVEQEEPEALDEAVENTESPMPNNLDEGSNGNDGFSSGWTFVIGILIGCIVGVGGVFVYNKYFKRVE